MWRFLKNSIYNIFQWKSKFLPLPPIVQPNKTISFEGSVIVEYPLETSYFCHLSLFVTFLFSPSFSPIFRFLFDPLPYNETVKERAISVNLVRFRTRTRRRTAQKTTDWHQMNQYSESPSLLFSKSDNLWIKHFLFSLRFSSRESTRFYDVAIEKLLTWIGLEKKKEKVYVYLLRKVIKKGSSFSSPLALPHIERDIYIYVYIPHVSSRLLSDSDSTTKLKVRNVVFISSQSTVTILTFWVKPFTFSYFFLLETLRLEAFQSWIRSSSFRLSDSHHTLSDI